MAHLLPDIRGRKDRSHHLFEFELRYGMIYGSVFTTSPDIEGVAVWLPSDKSEITLWRAFRAAAWHYSATWERRHWTAHGILHCR